MTAIASNRIGWMLPVLGLIAVLALSPPASALCKPNAVQAVVNPGSPTSTIIYFCPDDGCNALWSREGTGLITWTSTNDSDEHVHSCTWDSANGPVCTGHGHAGHNLTSTLVAVEPVTSSQLTWMPC